MPTHPADAPLIVTAHIDDASFKILNGLRRRHFPAKLNVVPAHVSLFHQLPGDQADAIITAIDEVCLRHTSFDLDRSAPVFLGRGVAIRFEAEGLSRIHADLSTVWQAWLTAQDRQAFKAHVTIQNKVESVKARALYGQMRDFEIGPCRVEGLDVWRYLGGPWEPVASSRFGDLRRAGVGA